jgi:hypothetical protein
VTNPSANAAPVAEASPVNKSSGVPQTARAAIASTASGAAANGAGQESRCPSVQDPDKASPATSRAEPRDQRTPDRQAKDRGDARRPSAKSLASAAKKPTARGATAPASDEGEPSSADDGKNKNEKDKKDDRGEKLAKDDSSAASADDSQEKSGNRHVVQTSHDAPVSGKGDKAAQKNWREHLNAAIAAMEAEARQMPRSQAETDLQSRLRLLYLLADRREDALKPVASASATSQEFLSQEVYGLATWLDSDRITDSSRRAGETRLQLANALNRLSELAPLTLRNLSFVHKVGSYGNYEPFDSYEFRPDQEVILYVEVENYKSEETPKGFRTALQGSYQIYNSDHQQVTSQDLGVTEDSCRNPRRDFFLIYGFHMKKNKDMTPGKYTLKLTIEDKKSSKFGQASIDFTIRESSSRP